MRRIIAISIISAFVAVSLLAPMAAEARPSSGKARSAAVFTAPGFQRLQMERALKFVRALELASKPSAVVNPLTIIDEPDPTGDTDKDAQSEDPDEQDKRPRTPKQAAPEKRTIRDLQ